VTATDEAKDISEQPVELRRAAIRDGTGANAPDAEDRVRTRAHACAGDAPRSTLVRGLRQLTTTDRSPGFRAEANARPGYDPRGYWSAVAEQVRTRGSGSLLAGDDSPFLRYKREAFLDRMLRRIAFRDKAVLEVGCGPGANLLEVAAAGPRRLVGCDIAPKMIELATENTAHLANVECLELADDGLPFRTDEFDVSFTVTVLQHNRDDTVRRLIAEMTRVTADSLYLIEDTTRRSRHPDRFVGWITGGTVRPESYVLRRVGDYAEQCAARGFDLVDVRSVNVYASDLMRVGVWFLDTHVIRSSRRREGESLSRFQARAEKLLLPITRVLDPRVTQGHGLTAMRFRARGVA
jgi:SAM-dependent methyltransferase